MQSLPSSGSRITSRLRATNNSLVQRLLGGSGFTQVVQPPAVTTSSTSDQLARLENVLAEVKATAQSSSIAQVVPQVIAQATDTLNVPTVTSARRPEQSSALTPDVAPELTGHVQVVEQELSPELSPEVEGYLQAIENHADQKPQEIVLADGSLPTQHSNIPVKKVIVLPISAEDTTLAAKKNPTWSIKWLVSWSERIIKMFRGAVVFRTSE